MPPPVIAFPSPVQHATAKNRHFYPLAFAGLALSALWFVLCRHLSGEWSVNEQYSYGWFVPFFALVLFWLRWEDRPRPEIRGQTSEVGGPRAEGESEANVQPAYAEGFGVAGAHLFRRSESEGGTPNIQRPIKNWRDQRSGGRDGRSEVPPSVAAATYGAAGGDQSLAISNQQSAISNNNRTLFAASLAIPALLLLLPLRVFEIGNPDWRPLGWIHTALVVVLTLIFIWCAGGKSWLRHFAFPIAFIFVAVPWISPIEQPIVQGLMRIVAAVAAETVTLFGIPAQLEGSLIRIPSGLVGVNEACSGVRSLQTALMIGLLFGELKRFDLTRRFALIVTAVAISLIANCGRAFFLVWVAANNGIGAVERWHDFAGYSIVALVFVGTLAAAALLARYQRSEVRGQNSEISSELPASRSALLPPFTSHVSRFTMAAALCWLLFVELAAASWYRAHEHNLAAVERWNVRWPESSPGFREIHIGEGVKSALRFDKGREVSWRAKTTARTDAAETFFLFFFRWQPGTSTILRARAHRPDICLPSAGWRQIEDSGVRNYETTPAFSLPFHHFAFVHDVASNQRPLFAHAFFCLHEDTVRVDEPSQINAQRPSTWSPPDRLRVVREGRRNPGQQVMELVLISPVQISSSDAEERFAYLVRDLIVASSK